MVKILTITCDKHRIIATHKTKRTAKRSFLFEELPVILIIHLNDEWPCVTTIQAFVHSGDEEHAPVYVI